MSNAEVTELLNELLDRVANEQVASFEHHQIKQSTGGRVDMLTIGWAIPSEETPVGGEKGRTHGSSTA